MYKQFLIPGEYEDGMKENKKTSGDRMRNKFRDSKKEDSLSGQKWRLRRLEDIQVETSGYSWIRVSNKTT